MAKTYKPATERQIKKGKGVSTDELNFDEALKYFQARGKEKNMSRFRHKGKVYDLSGKEIAPKAAPKTSSKAAPKAKDAMAGYREGDVTTTSLDKPKSDRRSGATEVKRQKTDAPKTAPKASGPTKTEKMRGDARTAARSRTSINNTKKKIRELQTQLDKNSAALATAALGAGVLTRGPSTARGKASNPAFGGQRLSPEGFQGRMNTSVGRPAVKTGAKGLNSAKMASRLRGGRQATIDRAKDPLMLD